MFGDLPDGCVAHVVKLLHSLKDVLNFQATCTRHAEIVKAQQTKWLHLLQTDYDIRLQVQEHSSTTEPIMSVSISAATLQASAQIAGQELYRSVAVSKPRTLRYYGCFTDGGVDEQLAAYWESQNNFLVAYCQLYFDLFAVVQVDNMYTANQWESYCSHGSSNVNCVGLLLVCGLPCIHSTQYQPEAASTAA